MIVAERKEYYSFPREEFYQQKNRAKKKRVEKVKAREKLRVILRLGLAFIIAFTIIWRFVIISEYNYRINKLEKELGELQKTNERLQLQLAKAQDIAQIEKYAKDNLEMVYPDNRDIIYVAVDKTQEETEIRKNIKGKYGIKGWIAALVGRMSSLIFSD